MFGAILLAGTLIVGGFIAVKELTKSTGEKVQQGDSVFVPIEQLRTGTPADDSTLKVFLAGFGSVVAKVSNVFPDPSVKDLMHGKIIGFGPTVTFPLQAVASIDRNGTRIV